MKSDGIPTPDTGVMTKAIRNWTWAFNYGEDNAGLLYGRMQCSCHASFGVYTSPHVYFDDMLAQIYWSAWDSVYDLVNALEENRKWNG